MGELYMTDIEGRNWAFRCNRNNELCYRVDGGKTEILQRNVSEEFDLVTDPEGRVHLIAQDGEGCIIYLFYDRVTWRKYQVLSSRSGTKSIRQFQVFWINGKICAFYLLTHGGRTMLIHHIFDREHFSVAPVAVDVLGMGKSYAAAVDDSYNCHIVYVDEHETLCYKVYKWSVKSYLTQSCPVEDEVRHVSAVCDGADVVHMACLTRLKSCFTICYYNFKSQQRKVLSFGVDSTSLPVITVRGKRVCVQWLEQRTCYECVSDDGGANFRKPAPARGMRVGERIPVRICGGADPLRKGGSQCIGTADGPSTVPDRGAAAPNTRIPGREVEEFASRHREEFVGDQHADIAELRANLARHETELTLLRERLQSLEQTASRENKQPGDAACLGDVGEIDEENLKLFEQMQLE